MASITKKNDNYKHLKIMRERLFLVYKLFGLSDYAVADIAKKLNQNIIFDSNKDRENARLYLFKFFKNRESELISDGFKLNKLKIEDIQVKNDVDDLVKEYRKNEVIIDNCAALKIKENPEKLKSCYIWQKSSLVKRPKRIGEIFNYEYYDLYASHKKEAMKNIEDYFDLIEDFAISYYKNDAEKLANYLKPKKEIEIESKKNEKVKPKNHKI